MTTDSSSTFTKCIFIYDELSLGYSMQRWLTTQNSGSDTITQSVLLGNEWQAFYSYHLPFCAWVPLCFTTISRHWWQNEGVSLLQISILWKVIFRMICMWIYGFRSLSYMVTKLLILIQHWGLIFSFFFFFRCFYIKWI